MTNILNTLALKPAGEHREFGMVFDPIIDGIPYLETLTAFEARFENGPAGAYRATLGVADIMLRLDRPKSRVIPYSCPCEEWECWWLSCDIEIHGDFVCWRRWWNGQRNDREQKADGLYWDYRELPPLNFAKGPYLAALAEARKLIEADERMMRLLTYETKRRGAVHG
ncbi:MAG: hypothetical protein COB37_06515 [Kordiimonadales bacterium]|nr:MAG: hypothetical protein COB37_06515 [Kordiimonadales bacterium]